MKRLLNTLYVTTQGAYLSRDGENLLVQVERETKMRLPIHTLGSVVCFGRVSCSPPLMHLCAERHVAISFLSERGRFWAKVQGPVSGNVLLRREQYRRADDPEAAMKIARNIVIAKVVNSRKVLLRAIRDHQDTVDDGLLKNAAENLKQIVEEDLVRACNLEAIRGREGHAARIYFDVFDHLILKQKRSFFFEERSRRPPLDNMNALLSFLYTLLGHDVASSLEAAGLDPAVGFLHQDRPGRPSLALDLMEEFRPYLVDRLALSLVNRQQVKGKGFTKSESRAVFMDDDTRKTVILAYQKRKQEEIRHPFLEDAMPVGLLSHAQAMLFARFIRGDMDGYPPFLWQ